MENGKRRTARLLRGERVTRKTRLATGNRFDTEEGRMVKAQQKWDKGQQDNGRTKETQENGYYRRTATSSEKAERKTRVSRKDCLHRAGKEDRYRLGQRPNSTASLWRIMSIKSSDKKYQAKWRWASTWRHLATSIKPYDNEHQVIYISDDRYQVFTMPIIKPIMYVISSHLKFCGNWCRYQEGRVILKNTGGWCLLLRDKKHRWNDGDFRAVWQWVSSHLRRMSRLATLAKRCDTRRVKDRIHAWYEKGGAWCST